MRQLTYHGRTYLRRFGKADGMTTHVEFVRGRPTEVADANAERILQIAPDQFSEDTGPEPAPEPPAPEPEYDAPSAGDDTTPEED